MGVTIFLLNAYRIATAITSGERETLNLRQVAVSRLVYLLVSCHLGKLVMRNDRVRVGMKVQTSSWPGGTPCFCTVIASIGTDDPLGNDYGDWLLDSPVHGHSIVRHHTEFNPDCN